MKNHVDFESYEKFVDTVTSDASTSFLSLSDRLVELDEKGANIERLLTAAVGISAEGGEFTEIVKKMAFQGKELTDESKLHMVKELGDVFWYFSQACMALDVDFNTVLTQNMAKLLARYPEGTFDIYRSENRREGDI